MTEKKIALIGDIVGSRSIKKRADFNSRLLSALQHLNEHHTGLLSPYTVTIGDEIQALFSAAGRLFTDTITIQAAIYPQRMRFAIAVGELVTPVNPAQAIGMDGPVFHLARDGIMALKKTENFYMLQGEIAHLALINAGLGLVSHAMQKWNANRFRILDDLLHKRSVKEIAATHAISEQAVYKNINAGALENIIQIFRQIEDILNAELVV